MPDDLREHLLATYADLGEAMVIQSFLEAGGVPCRIGDLDRVPTHMFGMAGGLRRSVGLWVLEVDVPRANALLADAGTDAGRVDEAALEAEALSAAAPSPVDSTPEAAAPAARTGRSLTRTARPRWLVGAVFALATVLAGLLAVGRCR